VPSDHYGLNVRKRMGVLFPHFLLYQLRLIVFFLSFLLLFLVLYESLLRFTCINSPEHPSSTFGPPTKASSSSIFPECLRSHSTALMPIPSRPLVDTSGRVNPEGSAPMNPPLHSVRWTMLKRMFLLPTQLDQSLPRGHTP